MSVFQLHTGPGVSLQLADSWKMLSYLSYQVHVRFNIYQIKHIVTRLSKSVDPSLLVNSLFILI